MKISRQSMGRRRNFFKYATNTLSRARRHGFCGLSSKRPLLLVAASLLVLSSTFFLLTRLNNYNDGHRLRSKNRAAAINIPTSKAVEVKVKKNIPLDFQKKHLSPPSDASAILFYNMFIPEDPEAANHAIDVITEQLTQVATSLQKLDKSKQRAVLYYNLIGNEHAYPEEKLVALCSELHSQLSCKQIGFYETASESVTLQDIWDFCQSEDVSDTRVTYIHSKGRYETLS